MSLLLELYTSRPAAELESLVRNGLDPFIFKLHEMTSRGPRFYWDHGNVIVASLSDSQKETVTESTRMLSPQSQLYFSPMQAGVEDIYRMTDQVLAALPGDVVLVSNADHITVARLGGELCVSPHCIYEPIFTTPHKVKDFPDM